MEGIYKNIYAKYVCYIYLCCVQSCCGKIFINLVHKFWQIFNQKDVVFEKVLTTVLMKKCSHRQDSGLLVEVDGVHDDEDLLVLVRQPARLLQGGLAVVLNPTMLAQEGGRQPDGQACNQQ